MHEKCLVHWMRVKREKGGKEGQCEVCHSHLHYDEQVLRRCRNCQQMISYAEGRKGECCCLLTSLILSLSLLAFLATRVRPNCSEHVEMMEWALLCFLFLIVAILIIKLVSSYCFNTNSIITVKA